MITFRRFTFLFFAYLLALNLMSLLLCGNYDCFPCDHMLAWYLGGIGLYLGISVAFAFVPFSGFHCPVRYRGRTADKKVSLTFDDGPDAVATVKVLEVLSGLQAPAAFFVAGSHIPGNESLVRRMVDEGHLVGNHGWSHSPWFDFFPARRMARELIRTQEVIRQVTGKTPLLFRPPYGVINPMVSRAVRMTGLNVVTWSIRSLDTVRKDPERILARITCRLKPGAVILLHDHSPFTAGMLETLVLKIREHHFDIVPLDQLLELNAYD